MRSMMNYWLCVSVWSVWVNSTLGCCLNDQDGDVVDHGSGGDQVLYYKIVSKDANHGKYYFNDTWYWKRREAVVQLESGHKNDCDVLKVIGTGNNWNIEDKYGNVFKNKKKYDSSKNTWMIVKIRNKSDDDGLIFYCDTIAPYFGSDMNIGVFDNISCWSIEIIAANTRAVNDMSWMFCGVRSGLEKDLQRTTEPGLLGLEKLNVESVKNMKGMFDFNTIWKQKTLESLKDWKFMAGRVVINDLFSFSRYADLNFTVLNDWDNGQTSFVVTNSNPESPFGGGNVEMKNKMPLWWEKIIVAKKKV